MKTIDLIEAAAFLRLHPHTLEAKARAGVIPGAKPGKCWVFIDVDLADWLRGQYRAGTESKAEIFRIASVAASAGTRGKSAARELEKLLAQKTVKPRRNATVDGGLPRCCPSPS